MTKLLELDVGQYFIHDFQLYIVQHISTENDIIQHLTCLCVGVMRLGTSTPLSYRLPKPPRQPELLGPEVLVELLT